ncbi:5'-nucleotidase, lipoprotein e(P4) family [Pontibacter chitinilyticus]|uniref:5'-nucleotidase, lipoprotein e(P4) family n=1 Tax=Pontibacter chitinilyticus TaxID=2674989 RepID=UPI00321A5A48
MKNLSYTYGVLLAGLLSACATQKAVVPAAVPASSTLAVDGKLWSSLWQQRAAEYKALCFQAYNIARLRLDLALQQQPAGKPLAIITDIDETVLDNSPNSVSQALQGKDYEPQAWLNWTSKAVADTVPGAPSFLKYAASKGVTIYYITNRSEPERESTLVNLQKYGFPNADDAHLLLKQASSGKEPRRQQVQQTHTIVLLLGDNLADFATLFEKRSIEDRTQFVQQQAANFGDKFIVLPNANYGDWEGAIYKYNYGLTPEQKEAMIKAALIQESDRSAKY